MKTGIQEILSREVCKKAKTENSFFFARNTPFHFLNSHSSNARNALKIRQVTSGK